MVNVLEDILDGHTGEDELVDEMDEVPEKKGNSGLLVHFNLILNSIKLCEICLLILGIPFLLYICAYQMLFLNFLSAYYIVL